jgi:hypothetical protein
MRPKLRHRWCVRHTTGWCACEVDRRPPESVDSVPTLCGFHVTLPLSFSRKVPTCKDCIGAMKGE